MPFDPAGYNPTPDLTELQPGREGLEQLSYLLRHPEMWPELHAWNFRVITAYTECGTAGCALGLADVFWSPEAQSSAWNSWPVQATAIFCTDTNIYSCPASLVTPTMVADALDFFLREGRVPVGGEASYVA